MLIGNLRQNTDFQHDSELRLDVSIDEQKPIRMKGKNVLCNSTFQQSERTDGSVDGDKIVIALSDNHEIKIVQALTDNSSGDLFFVVVVAGILYFNIINDRSPLE